MPYTAPVNTAIGATSKIGIAREAVYGQPTLAQKLLDRRSGSLDIDMQDPEHEVLRNITTDVEEVPGTSEVNGTIKVTATPEGLSRVIGALLGDPISLALGGEVPIGSYTVYGQGGVNLTDHTWKDSFVQVPHTLTEVKGPLFIAYPGGRASEMNFSIDKTQNTPVEFDFVMMALNKLIYGSEAAIGTDLAGFDPLPGFGPAQVTVNVGGGPTANVKQMSHAFKKNLGSRQVLNGYRGPAAHFVKKTDYTGTMNMYFDSDAELIAYFGLLDGQARPYGASRRMRTVSLETVITGEAVDAAGGSFQYQISLLAPRVTYKKVGQPVEGPDEIMQQVQWKAYHDAGIGSCFRLRIRNTESLAAIQTAGQAIQAVPVNGVQPLVVLGGVVQ